VSNNNMTKVTKFVQLVLTSQFDATCLPYSCVRRYKPAITDHYTASLGSSRHLPPHGSMLRDEPNERIAIEKQKNVCVGRQHVANFFLVMAEFIFGDG